MMRWWWRFVGCAGVFLLAGCSTPTAAMPPPAAPHRAAAPRLPAPSRQRLPGGGDTIFPAHRLVGFSGSPNAPALGRLTGDLDHAAALIRRQSVPYGQDRPVLPVFELVATIAQARPGPDGRYHTEVADGVIAQYLAATRRARALLLLNIQPGAAGFLDEVEHFRRWLTEPDIGVALDPEWAVHHGQVPGRVFGSTTGAELDSVAAYLSTVVTQHTLPEKVLVYHQVAESVVRQEDGLHAHPGVAEVKSIDGIGAPAAKTRTWQRLMPTRPDQVHAGFKLFYDEDARRGPMMPPSQVLALRPTPEYVLYE